MIQMKLPDIGEGVAEAELCSWKVEVGSKINENDALAEFITDKATVEIPSIATGVVESLLYEVGDIVPVGSKFIKIEESQDSFSNQNEKPVKTEKKIAQTAVCKEKPQATEQSDINKIEEHFNHAPPNMPPRPGSEEHNRVQQKDRKILATPAIKKEARDRGIDLNKISGTGPNGRITHLDLKETKQMNSNQSIKEETFDTADDHDDWERLPFNGIRKMISNNMVRSKHFIPHFTYIEEIDMTLLEKKRCENTSVSSPLVFICKACIDSLKNFPVLNSSLDMGHNELILKKKIMLGIAVAVDNGLLVPVIKNACDLNLFSLETSLTDISQKAKENQCKPEELKGSTFTISSLGKLGGLVATPIINYPETAIMGVHALKERPRFNDDSIYKAKILNLSLSVDHRVTDGITAARFMSEIKEKLENADFDELEES